MCFSPWSGERLGHAEVTFIHAVLLKPSDRPAGVGVKLAFLLGQDLVKHLIDEGERRPNRHRLAVRFDHLGVAAEDRHARTDGRLSQINRRDTSGLQGS